MLNRTPFKRSVTSRTAPAKKELNRDQALALRAQRAIKNAPNCGIEQFGKKQLAAQMVTASLATEFVASMPKVEQQRNPRLLALARGMPCLLRVPGVCNRDPSTTVAAHSNWAGFGGKGMGRKSGDAHSIWCCSACHIGWLDQGPAPKATKQAAFMRAHADQVLLWRQIAADPSRPPADRRAAQWALDLLKATPNTALALNTPASEAMNMRAEA